MEKEFKMLCGFTYEGVEHTTFTLREMTGAEQEMVQKSDIKDNGIKVINRLLAYCVTSIGTLTPEQFGGVMKWEKEVIRKLYSGDAEYMFIKLRELSLGEEIEVSHVCPECKAKLKTTFNLEELEVVDFKGYKVIPFELPSPVVNANGAEVISGTMRLPTQEDKEMLLPVAKKNTATAETMLLTRLCVFSDGTPFDNNMLRKMSVRNRKYLLELLADNVFGVKTTLSLECSNCGLPFEATLSEVSSDFFI